MLIMRSLQIPVSSPERETGTVYFMIGFSGLKEHSTQHVLHYTFMAGQRAQARLAGEFP